MKEKLDTEDIKKKILEGTKLALRRLVESKIRENSFLVFSENGKVVKVKAKDVKL
ncbi:MAG: hypothetical protein JNM88_20475 [Chitinophagaceae bacterium]|nr:hypothetical protein [Chitinophagaceae bacterium]MBL7733557.1 hypothetical protein [Chitinophagaceae bacterium]